MLEYVKSEVKKVKNEQEYLKIASKLEKNEYVVFKNLIIKAGLPKALVTKIDLQSANRFLNIVAQENKDNEIKGHQITKLLYRDEIRKIQYILSNTELLTKINGLKIMISGETGTGKTTLAKILINLLGGEYKVWEFKPENLVSSKMGQTQLNIIKLGSEISEASKLQKTILFIDEADSILTSRTANNDVAEFQRVASSFIKLLDELKENVLVIFLTNLPDKIDTAIVRRMNLHIKSKKLNIEEFLSFIKEENDFEITPQQENSLKKYFYSRFFTIAELDSFENSRSIDLKLGNIKKEFIYFLKYFLYKKPLIEDPSQRLIDSFKAEGVK